MQCGWAAGHEVPGIAHGRLQRSRQCSTSAHRQQPCRMQRACRRSAVRCQAQRTAQQPAATSTASQGASTMSVSSSTSAAAKAPPKQARTVAIAVDNTKIAEEAVGWAIQNVLKAGDQVHLLHVVSDPRTHDESVGASAAGLQRSMSVVGAPERRQHQQRLMAKAQAMVDQRFAPALQAAKANYKVDLLREQGVKSAAGIGGQLCKHAAQLKASLLLIASHGTGILADYGSVAKYCSEHSSAPVLMLPPKVGSQRSSGKLMIVALANISGLQQVTMFALEHLWRPGDAVHEVYVEGSSAADEATPSDSALSEQVEAAAQEWFRATDNARADFHLEVMVPPAPLDSTGDFDAGEEICDRAEALEARAMVLLHHGKGMMQEMIFGSITQYCSRNSKRPLCIFYGDKSAIQAT